MAVISCVRANKVKQLIHLAVCDISVLFDKLVLGVTEPHKPHCKQHKDLRDDERDQSVAHEEQTEL
jgi:hypothetical protein